MFHVVDDQPGLAKLICELLNALGHKAMPFTSPQQYIDYVASDDFSMPLGTITDVDMPIMNGYEMMEQIHRIHPEMRFVILSGEGSIDHGYKSMACMYFTKPKNAKVYITIFEKLLRCSDSGPANEIGCAYCDDRGNYDLENWSCPHLA